MSDLISRQAAIDLVRFECGKWEGLAKLLEYEINALPSAQPERKRGRFVETEFYGCADGNPVFLFYEWQCSECGCVFEDEEPTYNFCPNCGADCREGGVE